MNETGIIILAAGSSSRMGRPKQTLIFRGKPLLQHICDQTVLAGFKPIIVTGAHRETVCGSVNSRHATLVQNNDWESGMGSGIRVGLNKLLERMPRTDAVILLVCDQPFVSADLLQQLIVRARLSEKGIVASNYAGVNGTPVLFQKQYFDALKQLNGGARELLLKYEDEVESVPFEKGAIDIDTEEDYDRLLNHGMEYSRTE